MDTQQCAQITESDLNVSLIICVFKAKGWQLVGERL